MTTTCQFNHLETKQQNIFTSDEIIRKKENKVGILFNIIHTLLTIFQSRSHKTTTYYIFTSSSVLSDNLYN